MNSVKINNEIGLNYPDGFNEMSAEELTRHFGSAEQRWGISIRRSILSYPSAGLRRALSAL